MKLTVARSYMVLHIMEYRVYVDATCSFGICTVAKLLTLYACVLWHIVEDCSVLYCSRPLSQIIQHPQANTRKRLQTLQSDLLLLGNQFCALSHFIGSTYNEMSYRSKGTVVLRWGGRVIVCILCFNMFTFP
jgi:hypothetical protein